VIAMLRKFSSYEFGIAELAHLRHKIALVAATILLTAGVTVGGRDGSKDWIVLENCRLVPNAANDGDSFHVSVNGKEYIFRLYLVDAPEIDAANPTRLVEQAKHFGMTVPQVIEVGERAKAFVGEKLAEPFTVITHMANAMGRSNIERFYAFVQTKNGDLGEQLIANGLARIHGTRATPPGAGSPAAERQRLEQLEDEAKRREVGGWGMSGQPSNVANATPQPVASAAAPILLTPALTVPTKNTERAADGGKLDINTAAEKQLRDLPGIGPVLAQRIIAARPFRSADDLKKVNGIGEKKYEKIRLYFQ
jgi:competence ComEA-like helix-hairpin-helix protein